MINKKKNQVLNHHLKVYLVVMKLMLKSKKQKNLKFSFKSKVNYLKTNKKLFQVKKQWTSLLKLQSYYLDRARSLIYLKQFLY